MYKLLIADDDEIICRGLGVCLPWKTYGIEVIGMVYDGEMALEFVNNNKPDIILVDINMPFMDGIEFSYRVRQKYPEIKIILLTAYKEFEYAQKAVRLQVFEYVTKPFTNEEIMNVIMRAAKSLEKEREYRSKVEKNLDVIREKCLEELTLYGITEKNKAEDSLFLSNDSYYQVCVLYMKRIDGFLEGKSNTYVDDEVAICMAADRVRNFAEGKEGWNLFTQNNRLVFVFDYLDRMEGEATRKRIVSIMNELGKDDNLFLSCGIGKIYHGLEKLSASYKEASDAVEQRYGYGNQSIILYENIYRSAAEFDIELQTVKKGY